MGQPHRLKLPSVQARSARSIIGKEDLEFDSTDPVVFYLPVVQWDGFRIRGLCTGDGATVDFAFCRPGREQLRTPLDGDSPPEGSAMAMSDPAGGEAYEYTTGPTIAQMALAADAEGVTEVPGSWGATITANHLGENWLKVTVTPASTSTIMRFLDANGVNVGTYS